MKNKNFKIKLYISGITFFVFCFFLSGIFNHVYALDNETVAQVLGWILSPIVWVLGKILLVVIHILVYVATFNGFITSTAVTQGWIIVRDISNMFFIAVLLVIAFATILHRENYSMKQLLPKLILMAVLVNFSKMICGIIIDFSQVIMLTFVNGFKGMGESGMVNMLGIDKLLTIDPNSDNVTTPAIVGAYILALLYIVISIVVIGTMVLVLIYRIVMLWIYIVLSPAAYLLAAFPQGKSYSSQWWTEFTKQVIVGPVLAFFIWLSLISAGSGYKGLDEINVKSDLDNAPKEITAGSTEAGTSEQMLKYMISIAMLVGGLVVSQQIGGAAGKVAGKGMDALQKGKSMGIGLTKKGVVGSAKWVGRKGLEGASTLFANREGDLGKIGKFSKNWHENLVEKRKNAKSAKWQARFKKMGMDNKTIVSVGDIADSKVGRYAKTSALAVSAGASALVGTPFLPATLALAGAAAWKGSTVYEKNKREKEKKELDKEKNSKKEKISNAKKERDMSSYDLEKEKKVKKEEIFKKTTKQEKKLGEQLSNHDIGREEYDKKMKKVSRNYKNESKKIEKEYEVRIKASIATDDFNQTIKIAKEDLKNETKKIEKDFSDGKINSSERNKKIEEQNANFNNIKLAAESEYNKNPDVIKNNQNYDKKIEKAEDEYRKNTRNIGNEKKRQNEIEQAENITKLNKDAVDSNTNFTIEEKEEKKKKLDEELQKEKANINKKHDDYYKYSSGSDQYFDELTKGTTNKDWHPNGAIMGAVEKFKKSSRKAEQIRGAINGGKSVKEFSGWYSSAGQTIDQKEKFNKLTSDDKEAEKALNKINDTLRGIRDTGTDSLSKSEKNNLKNLIEGIVAYKKGGGDTKGKLDATIEITNEIAVHGDGKDEKRTYDELKGEVIEKA